MGMCSHPTRMEKRSEIRKNGSTYNLISNWAEASLDYIKDNLYLVQRGKDFMNSLDSWQEYVFGEANDFKNEGHEEYSFFIENALGKKGEFDLRKFKKLKKTIDSAFDKITVSKKARSFIAEIFGNLDDKKNEMLYYPENRLPNNPSA